MKSLLKGLNLGKYSKKDILNLLKEMDRDIDVIFRDNDFIKNRFYEDYRRVVRDGSLVNFVVLCSKIIKSMPKEGIMRGRLYSEALKLTDMLFKATGDPRFRALEKNLREMMKKKASIDPKRVLMEIRAVKMIKGEENLCVLQVKNRNPMSLLINLKEITSKSAEITVSGGEFDLRPGESGEAQIVIKPSVSGKMILNVSLQLRHENMEATLEHSFEIPVVEKAPETVVETVKEKETVVRTPAPQEAMYGDVDIEHMIRRGKPEEWLELIENLVDKDERIDLSKYSKGILAMYGERGYRNLLLTALIIDQSQIYPREVLSVVRGDPFTSRNLELLMELAKKKKLSMEPASSDAGYIREGLNIISGNYELPSGDKKKIKEWSIDIPNGNRINVKRTVLKDESGRAKKIIFEIENK